MMRMVLKEGDVVKMGERASLMRLWIAMINDIRYVVLWFGRGIGGFS